MEVKNFNSQEENKYIKALEVGIVALSVHKLHIEEPQLLKELDEDLKNLYELKATLNDILKDFKNFFGEV